LCADSAEAGEGVLLQLPLCAMGGEEVLEYCDRLGGAIGLKPFYGLEARVFAADPESTIKAGILRQ
jgi:hypothetical protein